MFAEGLSTSVLEAARSAWPSLPAPNDRFLAWVAARCPAGVLPTTLDLPGLYLAFLCVAGEPAALAAFEREEMSRVYHLLSARERDASLVDELCQRIRTRVLVPAQPGQAPRLAGFSGRGGLHAWLRIIALREHTSVHRDERTDERSDDDLGLAAVAPELALLRAQHVGHLQAALRAAIAARPPRERTLLRLHYADGLSLSRIGELYRVNKGTISRWLTSAREDVLTQALGTLQAAVGCSKTEAQSLARVLRSELDLTLPGLLG